MELDQDTRQAEVRRRVTAWARRPDTEELVPEVTRSLQEPIVSQEQPDTPSDTA
ncbi:hypothetical protein [Pyxidicoccus caerfyrddinensis]|uniref:hypothetical protein n=1 Tax=Pyxidicoccus caerfyrddinensis TaxID=2709663 RepID=UPI0013D9C9A8|nr:hypothetical protein [Pyxidicoccus caerfyrddinensis]